MEEMKGTIKRKFAILKVGDVETVLGPAPESTEYVSLLSGYYVESPTADNKAAKGRSFRVLTREDDATGGTATIVEVVKDSAGNWVEKVRPNSSTDVIRIEHTSAWIAAQGSGSSGKFARLGGTFTVTNRHGKPYDGLVGIGGSTVVDNSLRLKVGYTYCLVGVNETYWDVKEVESDVASMLVTDYKRVIKHFHASAYQEPDAVGSYSKYPPYRGGANAVGDVFLVVSGDDGYGKDKVLIQVVENCGKKTTNYIESPYANPADAVGKAFKVIAGDSTNWAIEEVPVDQVGRAASAGVAAVPASTLGEHFAYNSKIDNIATSSIKSEPSTIVKESVMNGTVYSGIVVRSKTVAAGEGVTTGVQISEVVYGPTAPKVYPNAAMASAAILAAAKLELNDALNLEDVRQPLEVKLSTPNAQ